MNGSLGLDDAHGDNLQNPICSAPLRPWAINPHVASTDLATTSGRHKDLRVGNWIKTAPFNE